MTDLEFMDHAEQLLLAVERSCDRINDTTDADVDAQRRHGHSAGACCRSLCSPLTPLGQRPAAMGRQCSAA